MEVVENEYQLQFPEDANSEFTKVMKNINFKEILQECNAPPGAILSSRDYV